MPRFLVEAYAPRISEHTCAKLETQAREAARHLEAEGRRILYLSSIFVREDETCFHLFEAESAEDVEAASVRAALLQARIVETV